MYMILWWKDSNDYLTHVTNENGTIRIFSTLIKADEFKREHKDCDNMEVISMSRTY